MISREQAKRIALDDVNAWKDVKTAKVKSIEKIYNENDEFSFWEVNGIYEWNEALSGTFTLGITEEGKIYTRISAAYPVPEGRTVPGARSDDAPQLKMLCPICEKEVSLADWNLTFDNPPTEIVLYTCKTPNCEYKNHPFAKDIETGDLLAPYDLREILYPPDWVTINRLEQK